MVRFPGGSVPIGTDDRRAAYDNERPRHLVELRAVPHRRHAGHERPVRRVSGRRRLRATRALDRRRLDLEGGGRRHRTEILVARRIDVDGPHVRPDRPRSIHAAPCATSAITRPRRSRAGPASACLTNSSGKRPHRSIRRPEPSERSRGATTRGRPRTRTSISSRSTPRRSAHIPVTCRAIGCYGMIGDVWEWTSSDFAAVSRLRDVPVRRVLRGVLRQRLQGAARRVVRHAARRHPQHVPQLGLPYSPPDLQRLPVRLR